MNSAKTAITPTRAQNFAEWYQEVIKAADLAEHSPVRGCMIIKPWGYGIWELMQRILDAKFKETGHQNAYFPLLIPLSFLEKEAEHVAGFAKECAVVTHHRLETNAEGRLVPSPDAVLTEPMIIRPTSETIIGHAFAKWVRSHNDLPILINQWANVMRWEMRTRLFLRTTEFLWQEGHTAHATSEEAQQETRTMLDVYADFAQNHLAIPVIKGEKTAGERFPGAENTYTIEAMMQDGKALQAGTSHFLGQNFAKANEIKFQGNDQQERYAWTTSWGVSTRMIGAVIMAHSDDDGLVLPPSIAPNQVIIIPIARDPADVALVNEHCQKLAKKLRGIRYLDESIRAQVDTSGKRGGDKFWDAVKKGVPLRIEIGKREIETGTLTVYRRDQAPKQRETIAEDAFVQRAPELLKEIHASLFARALTFRDSRTRELSSLDELTKLFGSDENALGTFALAHFDVRAENQPDIVERLKSLKLTTRCIPLDAERKPGRCIFTGNSTDARVIFARAY